MCKYLNLAKIGSGAVGMTKREASEKYNIPLDILDDYEKWNLCGKGKEKNVDGIWQYDDDDLEILSLIMTLHDTGFEKDEIKEYVTLHLKGDITKEERINILKQKRNQTLDKIHHQEKCLDCIDYLKYEINAKK